MTKQIFWTKTILETFIREGNLTKRQEFLLRTRVQGYTIPMQAEELHLSIDQVNKDIALLKKMYDAVRVNCPDLPPRKRNKKELYESIKSKN